MSDVKQLPLKPAGTLILPTMLCGVAGGLVGLLLEKLKVFNPLEQGFFEFVESSRFYVGEWQKVSEPISWVVAFGLALVFAVVVLDSAYLWRRILVGIMGGSLLVGAIFTLLLWGVLVPPFVILTAFLVSWAFSIIYASQHSMPSEGILPVEPQEPKVVGTEAAEATEVEAVSELVERENKTEPEAELKEKPLESSIEEKKEAEKEPEESIPMPKLGKAQKSVEDVVVKAPNQK